MNWDAIGAISDFVAAAAVIVTLIYLSIQIRDTHKTTKSHATFISVDLATKWRSALTQDAKMAEILAKANVGETLTDSEQIRLTTFAEELLIIGAVSFAVSEQSGSLHEESGEVEYVWQNMLRNPALIDEWDIASGIVPMVSEEYFRRLNKRVEEHRATNVS